MVELSHTWPRAGLGDSTASIALFESSSDKEYAALQNGTMPIKRYIHLLVITIVYPSYMRCEEFEALTIMLLFFEERNKFAASKVLCG
jgi:hypothetical protein